jgi:type VI protein secretion system component VasK
MRRVAAFITVLALLVPAPVALAQDNNPFNGLPPAQPTPAPTVQQSNTTDDGQNDRSTLFIIAGALLVTFVCIGWFIARDARRNLPQDERDRLDRNRDEGPHKRELKAKQKARAKARAQRQARKTTRKKARR